MRVIFTIAVRNLARNRRRTAITVAAIAFGLGALIFLRSFMYGAQGQMVQNIKSTLTSDLQVIPKSQENIYNINGAIEDPGPVTQALTADPRVRGFAEEVLAAGLVAGEGDSMATFIVGLDPEREAAMGNTPPSIVSGRGLSGSGRGEMVMGEPMRESLGLQLGDTVVLTGQDYYGSLVGRRFTLVGSFKTGNDQLDYGNVLIHLGEARAMLSFDHRASKILVNIQNEADTAAVIADLRRHIDPTTTSIMTWQQLIPMLAQMIEFQNGMIFVVVLVILIIVTAGILNTLMMAVSERTQELGLMMALGTPPALVMATIVCESMVVTLLGSLVGVGVGAAATGTAGHFGLDLSLFTSAFSNLMIGSVVYPKIDWSYLGLFVAMILGGTALVSILPALRASHLSPTEAMRVVN